MVCMQSRHVLSSMVASLVSEPNLFFQVVENLTHVIVSHSGNCDHMITVIVLLVDESEDQDDEDSIEFAVQDGYISYGSAVKLVCCNTGLSLPKLVCLCVRVCVCVCVCLVLFKDVRVFHIM